MSKVINKNKIIVRNSSASTSSSSQIRAFRTTITAANFKTIFSLPIELIPAQGANKIIVPIQRTMCVQRAAGTAYDFGADSLEIGLAINGSLNYGQMDTCVQFNVAGKITRNFNDSPIANFGAQVDNLPLYLFNQGADATVGAGSVTISFNYYIIDLS